MILLTDYLDPSINTHPTSSSLPLSYSFSLHNTLNSSSPWTSDLSSLSSSLELYMFALSRIRSLWRDLFGGEQTFFAAQCSTFTFFVYSPPLSLPNLLHTRLQPMLSSRHLRLASGGSLELKLSIEKKNNRRSFDKKENNWYTDNYGML